MSEWEAKYKALLAGITDENLIANAEQLVRTAMNLSRSSTLPFEQTFYALLDATGLLQPRLPMSDKESREGSGITIGALLCIIAVALFLGWVMSTLVGGVR